MGQHVGTHFTFNVFKFFYPNLAVEFCIIRTCYFSLAYVKQ